MARKLVKLVVVIGLPGSGKSRKIQELRDNFPGVIADDYYKCALPSGGSRHHDTVVQALKKGKNCLISDIEFCRQDRLEKLCDGIRAEVAARIELLYFANDPVQCKANVDKRAQTNPNRDAEREKCTIDRLSENYCPPSEAMPVWRGP